MKENEVWDIKRKRRIKIPKKMSDFFEDLEKLYRKYDFSISHEDCHGGFIIENYDEDNVKWIRHAHKDYERRKKNERNY